MNCPWRLVAVHWQDAHDGPGGWTTVSNYKPARKTVMQVGYVWPDCLVGHLTLVSSYSPDEGLELDEVGMASHIPLGMVLEVVDLVEPFMVTVDGLAGDISSEVVIKVD